MPSLGQTEGLPLYSGCGAKYINALNTYGQLGNPLSVSSSKLFIPVKIGTNPLGNIGAVAAGRWHVLAISTATATAGQVYGWGYGLFGQLGNGTTPTQQYTPTLINNLTNVAAVAAGQYHSLALNLDPANGNIPTVWAWGSNTYGQVGNTTATDKKVPNKVGLPGTPLTNVLSIAAGLNHSLAVKSGYTIAAWGDNSSGQLGDTTTTNRTTPIEIPNFGSVVQVAGGYAHSIALRSDGTVWAWGRNVEGQLGHGDNTQYKTPVQVFGLSGIIAIAAGDYHNVALKADGGLATWGSNSSGQLGTGVSTAQLTPLAIPGINVLHGTPDVTIDTPTPDTFVMGEDFALQIHVNNVTDFPVASVEYRNEGSLIGATEELYALDFPVTLHADTWGDLRLSATAFDLNGTPSFPSSPVLVHILPPIYLNATLASVDSVHLSWTTVPGPAMTYQVERRLPGEDPTVVATGLTVPVYTDSGLAFNPSTLYRVVGVNGGQKAASSPEVSATFVDSDSDGLPDVWELAWGFDRFDSSDAEAWILGSGLSAKQTYSSGSAAPGGSQPPPQHSTRARYTLTQVKDAALGVYHLTWKPDIGPTAPLDAVVSIQRLDHNGWVQVTTKPLSLGACDVPIPSNTAPERFEHAEDGSGPAMNEEFAHRLEGPVTSNESILQLRVILQRSIAYRVATIENADVSVTPRAYLSALAPPAESGYPQLGIESEITVEADTATTWVRSSVAGPERWDGDSQIVNGNWSMRSAEFVHFKESELRAKTKYGLRANDCKPQPFMIVETEVKPSGNANPATVELKNILSFVAGSRIGEAMESQRLDSVESISGSWREIRLSTAGMIVDANRDGRISFDDPESGDFTTADRPFRFWLNNDHDIHHNVEGDTDYDDATDAERDCDGTFIDTLRDLEDYTRLRISFAGLADVLKNSEYDAFLEWRSMTGAEALPESDGVPEINIYQERNPTIRPGYLEDTDVAAAQLGFAMVDGVQVNFDARIGRVSPGHPMNLFDIRPSMRTAVVNGDPIVSLLFCGRAAGRGQLIVTIKRGAQVVAQFSPVHIELLDIKDMYERWTVDAEPPKPAKGGNTPASVAQLSTKRFPTGVPPYNHSRPFKYNAYDKETEQYILFVHGWNVNPVEREQFAETAYKRLVCTGYTGHFGFFEWPTTHSFDPSKNIKDPLFDPTSYDRGEWSAWRSAVPLKNLLIKLNQNYPGKVYLLAHSMGNVVAGEALRLQSQSGGGVIVNTYVASQAALPAHCYDGLIAQGAPHGSNLQWLYDHPKLPGGDVNYGPHTPNIYKNWLAGNAAAVSRRVNFRNTTDYALAPEAWEFNQITKPDLADQPNQQYNYLFDDAANIDVVPPVNAFFKFIISPFLIPLDLGSAINVKQRYEIMSFAAEARSRALGASANVAGFEDVKLRDIWPADDSPTEIRPHGEFSTHKWHSAEFLSTYMRQGSYWRALLIGDLGFQIIP